MQISASISFDGFYVYENSEFLAISFNLSLLFQGIFSSPHFNVGRSSFAKVNKDHMFPIATSLRAPELWSWFVQPENYSLVLLSNKNIMRTHDFLAPGDHGCLVRLALLCLCCGHSVQKGQ